MDVRSIDFSEKRGSDRLKVTELSTCGFVERGTNVVVQGPAGTDKTYLACYVRQPDLEDLIERYSRAAIAAVSEMITDGVPARPVSEIGGEIGRHQRQIRPVEAGGDIISLKEAKGGSMKKGTSINSLMKHMRTNYGMEDLRGSDRKILL